MLLACVDEWKCRQQPLELKIWKNCWVRRNVAQGRIYEHREKDVGEICLSADTERNF